MPRFGLRRPQPAPERTGGSGPGVEEFYGVAARSYLARACGVEAGDNLATRALEEVDRRISAAPGGSDRVDVVVQVVREFAFGRLEGAARSGGGLLRRRCAALPTRLRERASGNISSRDLDRVYRHLDRCSHCAGVTGRVDAAEWHLHLALAHAPADVEASPSNGGSGRQPAPAPYPSEGISLGRAGAMASDGLVAPERRAPGEPPPPPPAPAGGRHTTAKPRTRWRRYAAVLAIFVAAAVIAAFALTTWGTSPDHPTPGAPVTGGSPTPAGARVRHTPIEIRPIGKPFVVAGARFAVVVGSKAESARLSARADPGAGHRWTSVLVTIENLTRTGFDPRTLHYRLVDGGRRVYLPDPGLGGGRGFPKTLRPLRRGHRRRTRLAFRVPTASTRLQLRFNPTTKHFRVTVPLRR